MADMHSTAPQVADPVDAPLDERAVESLRQHGGVQLWLVQALAGLARGDGSSLDGLLVEVGAPIEIDRTRTRGRCHFVQRDANDRPRIKALAEQLANQATQFCIPRSRIDEAFAFFEKTRSTEKFEQISREGRELFTKLEKSGEGGELLLYVLLEHVLRVPQVLCKMSLKTSTQMHVHGADGVHAKMLANGNLAVYWGESKLYKSVNGAIDACFESLTPFLAEEGADAGRRDLHLLRDNVDAGNLEVNKALIRFFDSTSPDAAKLEVRGACLVGFDLDEYPHPFDDDGVTVAEAVEASIEAWMTRVKERVGDAELASFEIELFCVPMPSVEAFRKALRQKLGLA